MHRIDEPHPFALESARLHYAADRHVAAEHLALQLALDFDARSIAGSATHTVRAVRAVRRVTFDAVGLDVSRVEVDGKSASFDASSGERLHVSLPRALKAGATAKVKVTYRARPQRGLYFVGPDDGYPKRPRQAWTQGQDIDSRHWFPCLDTPAQKCPSEVKATFPAGMTALSNGKLVADSTKSGKRTMHFRLDQPHSPYLVTLVVGEFVTVEQKAGATVIRTLVEPSREAEARRTVKRTPQMMALFEKLTGRPYPWGDYAQVFVSEFIFGGMENTSATTLTDSVLFDERAALDYHADFLVAHELAHQWFGDLLTCRDWPHGWLNEGFATYAEVLWKDEAEGADEADHQRKADLEAYLSEVSERYARPIVARKFDAPIDLFDRHLYEKGGLVLHELRRRLGDDDFFAVVRHYVAAHAGGTVETVDLARAVEQVTGKNLDRFFDEYVFRAGHPQLKVEASWEADHKAVRLAVKQVQESEPYELTLPVLLSVKDREVTHELPVREKEHVFFLPAEREPAWCAVDPRRDLLATLEEEKPVGWWRAQLEKAPVARARTTAAGALAKQPGAATVAALGKALSVEGAFWGTRAACAKALAALRSPDAKKALLGGLAVKHPKVRRAVVAALGEFRDDAEVAKALTGVCKKGDASYFVEADAARALGKVRGAGAFEVLVSMLERTGFQDTVRCGALDGLAELRDKRAWPYVLAAAKYGEPAIARRAAVAALAKLAEPSEKKTEAVELLSGFLRDPGFRVRLAAIDAAVALGDERMVEPLSSTPFLDGREQRLAREAVRTLRAKAPQKELVALRGDFEKLKAEVRALQEMVDGKGAKKKGR
ncbi:MAG: M1 family aminopeptidase [Myxococcota bacterium]